MKQRLNRYYDINYKGLPLPGFKSVSLYKVLSRVVLLLHEGSQKYRLASLPPDKLASILMDDLKHDKKRAAEINELLQKWLGKRLLLEREGEVLGPNPLHYKTASMLNISDFDDEGASDMFFRILGSDALLRREFHRYFSPQGDENAEEELLIRLANRLSPELDESPRPDTTGPASLCPAFNRLVIDDFKRMFAYRANLSRGTFVRFLEDLIGLHLATYEMLCTNIVNNYVKRGSFCPDNCPVGPDACDLKGCFCVDGVFTSSDQSLESLCQVAIRSFVSKIEKYRNYMYNLALLKKLEQFNSDGREFLAEPDFKEKPQPNDLLKLVEHPDQFSWFEAESLMLTEEESQGRRESFGLLDEANIEPQMRLISKLLAVLGPRNDSSYARRLEHMLGYSDGFGLLSSFRGNFMYYLSDKFIGFTIMLATLTKDPSGKYFVSRELALSDYCNFLRQRYGINIGGRYKGGNPGQDILRENLSILHRRLFFMGYVLDLLNRPVNPIIRPNVVIERT